jgi:hypothetical protein
VGLLNNGFRDSIGVFQFYGAGTVNGGYPSTLVANFALTGRNRNKTAGQGITDDTVGLPYGYRNPGAWMLPQKPGALSSFNNLNGDGDISSADGWAVRLATAAITGSGTLTATGGLIVQLVAAVTGSGTISDADMKAFLQLAAALSGSGVAAGPATGLGALLAALTGSGTTAGSTATGIGELEADITVTGTGLTTGNVGQAVWSALAVANNEVGTMGEKLNDAGSASNPWTEVIESGYTAAQILRLIAAAVQGNASGLEDGTPTFKGLDGTTDRVTATYSSGTRTVTGRDAD